MSYATKSPAGEGSAAFAMEWAPLLAEAQRVRENAWAPYSCYRVGAAILSSTGRIYAGCNVENASFGLTICAERNAVAQMVAAGDRVPVALVVITAGPAPGTPCGLCRQTLAEFAQELPIALAVEGEATPRATTTLAALFPHPFRADLARR